MAKSVRTPRPGMSYITAATRNRRPIFEIARVAQLFIDTLLHYRTLGHYKLHAYVVMPDHVHLLFTPQSIALEHATVLIKNGFSYRLNTSLPVWEENFTGYSVANIHDMETVRAYLHQLPVRAGLAPSAELYPHSSAYRLVPTQIVAPARPPQAHDAAAAPDENALPISMQSVAASLRKSTS